MAWLACVVPAGTSKTQSMGQCESLEDMWVQKEDMELETIISPLPLLATEAGPILHPKDQELKKCRCSRPDHSIPQVSSTLPNCVPSHLCHGSTVRCLGVQGSLIYFILVTDISSEGFDG